MREHQRTKSVNGGRVAFDIDLLDAEQLSGDEVALQNAIGVLEAYLFNPAASIESLVEGLVSSSNRFEFVMSALDEAAARVLVDWLIENVPRYATEVPASIAVKLLSSLSVALLFVTSPSSPDPPKLFQRYHRTVQQTLPVLAEIPKLTFDEPESPQDDADEDEDFGGFLVKRKPKGKKQQGKRQRPRRNTVVDSKPFEVLEVSIPTAAAEARILECMLLDDLRHILQDLLDVVRQPALREMFKRAYIPDPNQNVADMSVDRVVETPAEQPEENEDTPAAYPMVQPMKAALYFDSADGFGEWRILISQRADADLRQARKKDGKLFAIFVKKIKELSNGHFSDDNQKRLSGPETDVPIYEAKMTRDTRLVYQVDCVPEYESDVERQVLKIFGIYNHRQLDKRFWNSVSYQLGRKGREYRHRCVFRNKPLNHGDNVIMPASFPPPDEVNMSSLSDSGIPDLNKEDLEKMHEILVLEKYVAFSQALLNSILAETDVAHVFDVSPHEKKIIENPTSCYVIGRSGTGKTTTMLFKMLGIQRSWQVLGADMPKPRQLFVTQSGVLAEKVEEYFIKLLQSLATADQSPEELKRITETRARLDSGGLVDRDEEIEHRGNLPTAFSELGEERFPLFITFDQLCKLLERDLPSSSLNNPLRGISADPETAASSNTLTSNEYMQQRRAGFVSYTTFLASYWSHFPQSLTKGLDPHLVFSEFIGILKGSEQTLRSPTGYLDRETYCSLSHRSQGTFANQREKVYQLFLAYIKTKRERAEWDAADRSHAILAGLREKGLPGHLIDFVYIDEAQDNLLIDALILRSICKNPSTGLFWAGDTAQTISVGSAFRFNDLKAFLHRVEAEQKAGPHSVPPQPKSFQLAVNYRSHAGIVNCAHSIVELITQFWPHAIDNLAEERGLIEGLKPVFFSGWDDNNVRYEQFLFGDSGNQIEFGAQQCILVRDDAARAQLREQVGDIGLIMTVYESKGLEFNDVLLYNFFHDSTADASQWRVVLNGSPAQYKEARGVPRFDETRHSVICRELKLLYVAITRARMNLWIADGSERGEPLRTFWTARDQIQNCTPGTDVPRLAVSSTPEEWAKTGRALFNKRSYTQAMYCFERAALPRERDAAHAYALREQAREAPTDRKDNSERVQAFVRAAEAFERSAESAVKEKRTYFRIAAECFVDAEEYGRAGRAYLSAGDYNRAAQHYRKAGMFEQAVNVVDTHRDGMAEEVADGIVDVARIYYLREHKIREALRLFDSEDDALEYMDDYGLDIARATLLESQGKVVEAAELHHAEGRTLKAIELLTGDVTDRDAANKAARWLLDGLWRHLSLGISPASEYARSHETLRALIRLLVRVDDQVMNETVQDEILMFKAIVGGKTEDLLMLGERFLKWHQNIPLAFMCYDHAFSGSLKLKVASLWEVTSTLKTFLSYTDIAHRLLLEINTLSADVVRLFALQNLPEGLYLIPEHTLLHNSPGRFSSRLRSIEGGFAVSRWNVAELACDILRTRVRDCVREENDICRKVQCLSPCLVFAASGRCNRNSCPQDHSETVSKPTVDAYNARLRIHLQQILIYNSIQHSERRFTWVGNLPFWLHRLYESLHPASFKLGGPHVVQPALIPEFEMGFQVVRAWIQNELFFLKPENFNFLTTLMQLATIAFNSNSMHTSLYVDRIPAVVGPRLPKLCREDQQVYIVPELLKYIQGIHRASVAWGILGIRHVLEQRLPINIEVLCDTLDHLCATMVVTRRLKWNQTLHDVTLPRSWLARIANKFGLLSEKTLVPEPLYIRPLGDLLQLMNTAERLDHLLFERVDLGRVGFQVRNIFIARICKNLALLGYNLPNLLVRAEILKIFNSLKIADQKLSSLYDRYVLANSWAGVAAAVRYSTMATPLDEMIQIHHVSKGAQTSSPWPNVRRLVYQHVEEIYAQLDVQVASIRGTALNYNATPFVPASQAVEGLDRETPAFEQVDSLVTEPGLVNEETVEDAELSLPSEYMGQDDGGRNDENMLTDNAAFHTVQAAAQPSGPTDEEVAAACKIQAAYRHYIRIKLRPKSSRYERIRQVTCEYHDAAKAVAWSATSLYRLMFLGPLPHLAVCLEGLKDYIHTRRTHTRQRLRVVAHLELEHIQKEANNYSAMFKEAISLQKSITVQSDLHARRDVTELKSYVQKVEALMRRLPAGAVEPWEDDLALAITSIVAERQVATKPLRHELNVDEDFDL